jgi:two-component system sensor histidine kinase SenX3
VFVEDVTERRRIEQIRTDFVANISHELKTPVGAMSVLAETLEDEADPATISRIVDRMISEAQRATRTIDDLMELSRIEAGGEREFEPIEAELVVAGALERVTELASHREIGLSNLTPVGRLDGVVIMGDRRQLVSALGNLVENAVKYSEPGGQVQIRTRLGDDGVEFSVTDQGVGIPQRDLDRIFERFYRVDRARSRATGGTGLGLSIVRHVANNHGGKISVVSTEGEGSIFTLTLPAHVEADGGGETTDDPRTQHSDRGIA